MTSRQERQSHASEQYSYANTQHKFNWRETKVRTIKGKGNPVTGPRGLIGWVEV
jgi:hypothetical protein